MLIILNTNVCSFREPTLNPSLYPADGGASRERLKRVFNELVAERKVSPDLPRRRRVKGRFRGVIVCRFEGLIGTGYRPGYRIIGEG